MADLQLPDQQPQIRVSARPADTNPGGIIFGGWLMSQMDVGASIVAVQRAKGRVVTVAVNSMHFKEPVQVGDLVSVYAHVASTGRSSMVIAVEVYVQAFSQGQTHVRHVADAEIVFVAIGDNRKPRSLP